MIADAQVQKLVTDLKTSNEEAAKVLQALLNERRTMRINLSQALASRDFYCRQIKMNWPGDGSK